MWVVAKEKLQLRVPQITLDYLQDLLDSGVWGDDISEVGRRAIDAGIQKAIADGIISKRQKPKAEE